MNITGVSSSSDLSQRYAQFNALGSALQSGNITNAQHAFAAFQQEVQKASQTAGIAGLFAPGSQPSRDLQRLNSALNSADLAGAKTAFASLKQDIQSAGPAGHTQPAHTLGHSSRIVNNAQSFASSASITAVVGSILNSQA
jgi:hypothetical protein